MHKYMRKPRETNLSFPDVDEGARPLLDRPVQNDPLPERAQVVRPHVVRCVQGVEQPRETQARVHREQLFPEVLWGFRILNRGDRQTESAREGGGGGGGASLPICGVPYPYNSSLAI